jgi:hypothetical protein
MKVPRSLLELVVNYLSDNTQYVKLGKKNSDAQSTVTGVVQGGVLSPQFYSFVTDPLKATEKNCIILKYADDTVIVSTINNKEDLTAYQREIDHVQTWSEKSGLILNPTKSVEIVFKSKKKVPEEWRRQIKIGGSLVVQSNSTKYLGMTIDTGLTFKNQVEDVYKKCFSRSVFAVRLLRNVRNSNQAVVDFVEYCILSCLLYALPIYAGYLTEESKRLLLKLLHRLAAVSNMNSKVYVTNFVEKVNSLGTALAMRISRSEDHPLRPDIQKAIGQRSGPVTRNGIRHPKANTSKFQKSFLYIFLSERAFLSLT